MKRSIATILFATLPLTLAGCNGSSHSSSDPGTAPLISNLKNDAKVERTGSQQGQLSISFDYSDPDGDIALYVLTVSSGQAANPLAQAAGKTSGTVNLLQAMFIPERGTMTYRLQLEDKLGHRSNVLEGSYIVE